MSIGHNSLNTDHMIQTTCYALYSIIYKTPCTFIQHIYANSLTNTERKTETQRQKERKIRKKGTNKEREQIKECIPDTANV